jgi:3-isopropylmalate dehydrogenase
MKALIAVLPGDGVGPEVTRAAVGVLQSVAQAGGHDFAFEEALIGGAAIDATGQALPDETLGLCRHADAVLLGAVGGPRWDDPAARVRPEQGLLAIRRELGLYLNLRPVRPHPALTEITPFRAAWLENVDLLVVRELTGGIYFGEKSTVQLPDGSASATDVCTYTTHEIERVARAAARLALSRRGRLTSIDKANVLETSRLWRKTVTRIVQEEFPALQLEHMLVDSAAMRLIQTPGDFDVIVTENMFGDILTDEAAVLAGSIGMLPSASLGAERPDTNRVAGLYEPIHGSAPTIAGQGIANPIGAILSAALLLRLSLGLTQEADWIEAAVDETVRSGIVTRDAARAGERSYSTGDVGNAVALHLSSVIPLPWT